MDADLIVGHNVINFDLEAIKKVYPTFRLKPGCVVRDTLVLTRLFWPHIKDKDFALANSGKLPKKLIGRHSLEAWGYRLGNYKGDFKGPWDQWTPEMHEYMEQDVHVTASLWQRCETEASAWKVPLTDPNPPPRKDCIELEHRVAQIVQMVEAHGFRFDESKAIDLVAKLTARKLELEEALQRAFPPKTVETVIIPKVNNRKLGYVKGEPFIKRKVVPFSPGSRQQIGERLMERGWKPTSYGKDGNPTVDEEVLSSLPYAEAKLLSEFFMIEKRLGQIAHGKEAWLRHVRGGRIHGRIHSNAAHTGRATHSNPNVGQVPGHNAPYGKECRECWMADDGWVVVGVDMDAVELRDLAGYMAHWDGGAYIDVVLNGKKEDGTDIHSRNAALIGCSRAVAKVFFYAWAYGSGDANLGRIIGKSAAAGKAARERLMKGLPALGKLTSAVKAKFDRQGFFKGLDGRRLYPRSANAALNTLLQSAGAVQSKRWIANFVDAMDALGLTFGTDYAIVAWVHDELVITCKEEIAEAVGKAAVQAIEDAGKFYNFACPLTGQAQYGLTWADVH